MKTRGAQSSVAAMQSCTAADQHEQGAEPAAETSPRSGDDSGCWDSGCWDSALSTLTGLGISSPLTACYGV